MAAEVSAEAQRPVSSFEESTPGRSWRPSGKSKRKATTKTTSSKEDRKP